MQELPLVSIGILSYNRPEELRRAIESVLLQTYHRLEILISDNGSQNPNVKQVVAEYAAKDKRIKTFFHNQNRGPQFNFDFLMHQASGKYFSWLADDDAYSLNAIQDCVAILEEHPNVVLASNMPVVAGMDRGLKLKFLPHTAGLPLCEKYELVIRYLFEDINLFYYGLIRLDCLQKCSIFLKKLFGSDLLLPLELLAFGDIFINQDKLGYIYSIHMEQTSASSLRYRQITLQQRASFIERHAFFTAYIFYMVDIVKGRHGLSSKEKWRLVKEILHQYISSHRYHLLKYDLGIHRLVVFVRKLIKGSSPDPT